MSIDPYASGTSAAPEALLSREQVALRFNVSVQTINRWVKVGDFPRPLRLSARNFRWSTRVVEEYIAARKAP